MMIDGSSSNTFMNGHAEGITPSVLFIPPDDDMNTFKQGNSEKKQELSLKDFDHLRVTIEKDIPNPDPTITIGSGAIASPGNITILSAQAKAGKTALSGVFMAGAISKDGNIDGFSEIKVQPNPEGKAVIHMDTEQAEDDQQDFLKTILRRANITSTPDYFRSYNIRQLTLENYRATTDSICELCNQQYKGIHLIVIDGGADYIASVNDEIQANAIVQYFIHLSIKYACPVLVNVHLNPGSEKERGHFGSSAIRKCYGLITIEKDGDISCVKPKILRKAGNADVPLIYFAYSKEKGYHVQTNAPDKEAMRAEKNMEKTKEIAEAIFTPLVSFSHKEAVSKIMMATSQGESSAKTKLKNMVGWSFVDHGPDGNYRKGQGSN